MLFNRAPFNQAPFNSDGGTSQEPEQPGHETVVVALGAGARWRLRVLVNGLDVSHRLTGSAKVDREAGAARIAELSLVPEPGPLSIDSLTGTSLQIYRQRIEGEVVASEQLRFTGIVKPPRFSSTQQIISLAGTCDLQNRVEALTVAQINALAGGNWSPAVFGELESHWQYASDRMSTRQADLDCAPDGTMRVTSWEPAAVPHFRFGPETILDGTLDVAPADASQLINRIELAVEYRYTRLRHREHTYTWTNPAGNFCGWYVETFELPTRSMLLEALEQADWEAYSEPLMTTLPPDMVNPCQMGGAWYNSYTADPHLLSFSAQVARRTSQALTERYTITLTAPGSVAVFGERLQRERYSDDVEYDSRSWEALQIDGRPAAAFQDDLGDWVIDKDEGARRSDVLQTALAREVVRMADSHRQTRVSFQTPIVDHVYDTTHTVHIQCLGTEAMGLVTRVQEEWDIEAGTEIASIEFAVRRGGNASDSDDLVTPARPVFDLGAAPEAVTVLATQLGGRPTSPPFNEDLDGFSGNYSVIWGGTQTYSRQLSITTPDIGSPYRDPAEAEQAASYRVALGTDLLTVDVI